MALVREPELGLSPDFDAQTFAEPWRALALRFVEYLDKDGSGAERPEDRLVGFLRGLTDEDLTSIGVGSRPWVVGRIRSAVNGQPIADPITEMAAVRLAHDQAVERAGQEPPPAPVAGFIRLADVEERPVEWLADWLIPRGALTLLVGPGGLGKTTFALTVAARLTRGQPIFPGLTPPEPANALVISGEDAIAQVLRPRARLAGADLERVLALDLAERDFSLPDSLEELRQYVGSEGIKLVVVDPVAGFLGRGVDSHRDASLRGALRPIHAVAEATGAAVIGIVHPNQSASVDIAHKVSGAEAWVNAARSALVFTRMPDAAEADPARVVAVAKSNYGPLGIAHELALRVPPGEAHPVLSYVGPSHLGARDLLASHDAEEASDRQEAEALLVALLGDGEWHDSREVKDVAKREGMGDKPLRVARERLEGAGRLATERRGQGRDHRSWWRLTDSCPPRSEDEGTSDKGTSDPDAENPLGQWDHGWSPPGTEPTRALRGARVTSALPEGRRYDPDDPDGRPIEGAS
jgi:RecA-family ATPase